jgi:hypothetical protein
MSIRDLLPGLEGLTMVSGSPVSHFKGKLVSRRWPEIIKDDARNVPLYFRFDECEYIVTSSPRSIPYYEISLPYSLGSFPTERWTSFSRSVNRITGDPTIDQAQLEQKVWEIIETNIPGRKQVGTDWINTTVPGWLAVAIEGYENRNEYKLFVPPEDDTAADNGAASAPNGAPPIPALNRDAVLLSVIGEGIETGEFAAAAVSHPDVNNTPLFTEVSEQGVAVLANLIAAGKVKEEDGKYLPVEAS